MDDDPHLLSLADALTCAFGASIALFLIFVVLVRFEPPAPVPTSGTQAASSIVTSLANDKPGISSLIILASSRVSGTSCAGSAIEGLELKGTNSSTSRSWSSMEPVWDGVDQVGVLCRRVFEIPDGVSASSRPALWATRGNGERIDFRVHVGANAWPSWHLFHRKRLEGFVAPAGVKLLEVTGDPDEPVKTREDS